MVQILSSILQHSHAWFKSAQIKLQMLLQLQFVNLDLYTTQQRDIVNVLPIVLIQMEGNV